VLGLLLSAFGVAAFASSAAADSAAVWLTKTSGAAVPENSQVSVGQHLTIHVSGFNADAAVLYQFGSDPLPATSTANSNGAATAAFTVPKLKSDVYVITATSDQASATFVVTVLDPATAAPAPRPAATHVGATAHHASSAAHPASLAHTGAPATLGLTLAGAALLAFGTVFIKLGAPVFLGRHERIAGSHRR
jgi:hypothetical protein